MIENHLTRITTKRLIIRPYEVGDALELKTAIDESLEHLLPWMPWAKYEPEPLGDKIARIQEWETNFKQHKDFFYGIFSSNNKTLIGSTGLHPRRGPGKLEIGYWIRASFIGKGYATEAAYGLTKAGLFSLPISHLLILMSDHNLRSQRIPEKLNYSYLGIKKPGDPKRPTKIFEISAEEFIEIPQYEPVQF